MVSASLLPGKGENTRELGNLFNDGGRYIRECSRFCLPFNYKCTLKCLFLLGEEVSFVSEYAFCGPGRYAGPFPAPPDGWRTGGNLSPRVLGVATAAPPTSHGDRPPPPPSQSSQLGRGLLFTILRWRFSLSWGVGGTDAQNKSVHQSSPPRLQSKDSHCPFPVITRQKMCPRTGLVPWRKDETRFRRTGIYRWATTFCIVGKGSAGTWCSAAASRRRQQGLILTVFQMRIIST